MPGVFALSMGVETLSLLNEIFLRSDKFRKLACENKIELSNHTQLLRLSFINLIENTPANSQIKLWKFPIMYLKEFDNYLEKRIA